MIKHPLSVLLGALGALLCVSLMGARNGSGTYSLPAGNPVSSGTVISSSWANTTLADIRDAISQSVSKDGQTQLTGSLNFGGNSALNAANLCTTTACGASELIGTSSTTVRLGNGSNWTALSTSLAATFNALLTGTKGLSVTADTNGVAVIALADSAQPGIRIKGSTTGANSRSYIDFTDSAGSRLGYTGAPAASGATVLESDNGDVRLIPVSTTGKITASLDGGATFTDMTPYVSTFTATLSGAYSGTATLGYFKMGPIVRVYSTADYVGTNGVSNAVTITISSLPAAIRPSGATNASWTPYLQGYALASGDNIYGAPYVANIASNGVVTAKLCYSGCYPNNTAWGFAKSQVLFTYYLQ